MEEQRQTKIFQKFKKVVKLKWFKFKEVNKVTLGLEINVNLETNLDAASKTVLDSSLETKTNEEIELKNMDSALRLKNSPYIQHKRFSLSTLDSMVSLTSHAVRHIPKIAHHLYRELWLDFHANNNFTYVNEIIVHENDNTGNTIEILNFNNRIDILQNKEKLKRNYLNEEQKKKDFESGNGANDSEFNRIEEEEEEEEEINLVFLIEDESLRAREIIFNFRRLGDESSNNDDSSETLAETNFNDTSDLGSVGSDDTMAINTNNNVPFLVGWFINRSDGLNTLVNFVVRNELLGLGPSEDESDILSLHSNSEDTATTNAGILEFAFGNEYVQGENEEALVMLSQISNYPALRDNLKGCQEKQLMENLYKTHEDKRPTKRIGTYSDDSFELIDLNVKVYMEGNSKTEEKK